MDVAGFRVIVGMRHGAPGVFYHSGGEIIPSGGEIILLV